MNVGETARRAHSTEAAGFGKFRPSERVAPGDTVAGCRDSEETHEDGSNLLGLDRATHKRWPGPRTVYARNSENKVAVSSDARSQNMRVAVCQNLRMTGVAEKELHAHACLRAVGHLAGAGLPVREGS